MIRNIYMWRYSIVCLLLLGISDRVLAQNVVFTTNASAEKIGVQDQLQVSYTIQDANNLKSMSPQNLSKDFNVLGGPYQSNSSQMSYSGNGMTQTTSISITYVLQPRHTGTLTIPAAIAKDADGHVYQSNALAIQVVQGSLAPRRQQQQAYDPFGDDPFTAMMQQRQRQMQAMRQQQQQQNQQQQQAQPANVNLDKDLFIRVSVDKSKVHVGEQITASYKLYARVPMNVSISKLPSLNGFWTQDFEMPKSNIKPTEEVVDGKKYQVFLLKKSALFPQQTGTLELDPAEAEGVARIVQQVRQRNPFDDPFFQNPFGSLMMNDPFFNDDFFNTVAYRDVKVHLKSTPVKITVTPLPDKDKPADFSGAVGNFTASAKVDKTELTTDDVLNYKLTITGSGNLKLINAPRLNLPNGLSAYDPQVTDTITSRSTTISGSKIITYAIAANTPGDYTIPSLPFTYFNPQSGAYVTMQTDAVRVHVKKGKNKPGDSRNTMIADIHHINAKPLKDFSFSQKPLFFTAGYWSMYAVPLLAFIGLIAWKRRDEELSKDMVKLRNRRANKIALKRLHTAQKLLQQNKAKPFYEEISKAIWLYLSDKLNIPLSALSREHAREALTQKHIPYELQQQAEQVIDACEIALYAPTGGTQQMEHTYRQAIDVISKLEESF